VKSIRIVPEANRGYDNAPSHWVYVGRVEIGAAWSKRSQQGRDCLSVKLDDPSFNSPIYANPFEDGDGADYTLIWSRSRKQNGDRAGSGGKAPTAPPAGRSSPRSQVTSELRG
jgi:uncharacterized protein (DUF736 family)